MDYDLGKYDDFLGEVSFEIDETVRGELLQSEYASPQPAARSPQSGT